MATRSKTAATLAAVLLLAFAATLRAQTYPTKPITIIVPFPPGGSSEILMRIVAQKASEGIGQQMIIDMRPGGGGATGAVAVKRSSPDGYTIMQANLGSHGANTVLVENLPYDPIKDFKPITQMWVFPSVLVVPSTSQAKSVAELVAMARSRPSGINYASQGVGSGGHILGAMFKSVSGAPMVHVPYKGAGPAVIDVAAGRVDMIFAAYPSTSSFVKEGRLRLLAVSGSTRIKALPEVASIAEAGFPGVDLDTWFGMVAPAGTPDAIIARLRTELVKAVHDPKVEARMYEDAVQPKTSSPAEFAALIAADIGRLAKLAKELGAKGD